MIERDILLRLAREFAERKANERETLQAAYLIGSVARGEPPLGDATDLDIVLIDVDPPHFYEPYVRLSDTVTIDYFFTSPDEYDDKQALRQHPLFGPNLFSGVPLYDPRHKFDLIQAAARSQIDRVENVYARARTAYRWAHDNFEAIQVYRTRTARMPLDPGLLLNLLAVVEWGATAVLMLRYKSHSARRHLITFETACNQMGRADLYAQALAAMGVHDLNAGEIEAVCEDWHQLYGAANRYNPTPTGNAQRIHPLRQLYYLRGFETLGEAGHAQNALLLLEQTLALAVDQIERFAPEADREFFRDIYAAWLARSHKGNGDAFGQRVQTAGRFLQAVDTLLLDWAHAEGVTP